MKSNKVYGARVLGILLLLIGLTLGGVYLAVASGDSLLLATGAGLSTTGLFLAIVNPKTRRPLDWMLPHRLLLVSQAESAVAARARELIPDCYEPARILVEERLTREFSPQLSDAPEASFECLEVESLGAESSLPHVLREKQSIALAGLEAGGLLGSDLFLKYAQLDAHIYEGIGRMAGEQISSLGDLSAKLQGYSHELWSGLTRGALSKVFGHVGEVVVHDHLADAGLSVAWPAASNQIGWDLLVEGHEVNVKAVADAYQLATHFDKFPHIPVIVPGDTLHLPESAVHFDPSHGIGELLHALESHHQNLILVDDSLNHADLVEHVHDATDLALGATDIVEAHLPVFTIAMSSWRELSLLRRTKTDIQTVVTHVVVDAAGTGGGGFLGGKAGAAAGTLIAPGIGTLVGAIGGGVLGAMGGRSIAKKFKFRTFDELKRQYDCANAEFEVDLKNASEHAAAAFGAARTAEHSNLLRAVEDERSRVEAVAEELCRKVVASQTLSAQEAARVIIRAQSELRVCQEVLATKLRNRGFWRRVFLPDLETLAIQRGQEILRQCEMDLGRVVQPGSGSPVAQSYLFEALAKCRSGRELVRETIQSQERARAEGELRMQDAVNQGLQRVAAMRVAAFRNLIDRQATLAEEMQAKLAPQVQKVTGVADKLRVEGEKLGYTFRNS